MGILSDYFEEQEEQEENYELRERKIKIIKGQARFIHQITGRDVDDLIMLLVDGDREIKNILSRAKHEFIPDLEDKNISLILEDMYSLSGKKPPLSIGEIKKKYLGKISSIEKDEHGRNYPLDYKTVIHLAAEGIKSIKEGFESEKRHEKVPVKRKTRTKITEAPKKEKQAKEKSIKQMNVEDQVENIRLSKKLLNSLGIIDNEKIRLFAKSISLKEFSVFSDMHPLYEEPVLSMEEIQLKHNISLETIWKISDKVLKKLSNIVGVTIPQTRLIKQDKKDKAGIALSYNIYVEKILDKYNIKDINIIYALSNRLSVKSLLIYLQLVPLGNEKPLTIEEVLSNNKIEISDLKTILNEIRSAFLELAKIEIKCPVINIENFDVESKNIEEHSEDNEKRRILEKVLQIHGINNPEVLNSLLRRLNDRQCLILSMLYEKNMSFIDIAKELNTTYYGVTDAVEKIRNILKNEFGIKLNAIKRSKITDKYDNSKSKEKKANEIRGLARKTLEYFEINDEEKLEKFISEVTIHDLIKFLKQMGILGYQIDETWKKTDQTAVYKIRKQLKEIFGINFKINRDKFSENQRREKTERIRDRVILLLNYYGITDNDKVEQVCEEIKEADLDNYLSYIGLIQLVLEKGEGTIANSVSSVKRVLNKVCALNFDTVRSYTKYKEKKVKKLCERVTLLLNYYGVTDIEKINSVCEEISESDLDTFLIKLGLATELNSERSKFAICAANSRVRKILNETCGVEFEESTKKETATNEDVEEFTNFFYKKGITDSQQIKHIINSIGVIGLKIFISEVSKDSTEGKSKNEKQKIWYYVKRVQDTVESITGIKLLTYRQEQEEQTKSNKENNIIYFQLSENQIERLTCMIRESKDIKRITAMSLILNLANRNDVSYNDLASALNISVSLAKKRFLLALQEVKDAIGIQYDEEECIGGRCKKTPKEE